MRVRNRSESDLHSCEATGAVALKDQKEKLQGDLNP